MAVTTAPCDCSSGPVCHVNWKHFCSINKTRIIQAAMAVISRSSANLSSHLLLPHYCQVYQLNAPHTNTHICLLRLGSSKPLILAASRVLWSITTVSVLYWGTACQVETCVISESTWASIDDALARSPLTLRCHSSSVNREHVSLVLAYDFQVNC